MKLLLGVLEASISGSIAILVFGLFSGAYGSRFKKKSKMLVWFLIMTRLLFPIHLEVAEPKVTVEVPVVELEQKLQGKIGNSKATENTGGENAGAEEFELLKEACQTILLDSIPFLDYESVAKKSVTSGHMAVLLWLGGGALFLVYHFSLYYFGSERIYQKSFKCTDARLLTAVRQNAEALKLKKIPEIRVLENADKSPFTMGIWQNTIFLPDKEYEDRKLNYVLKHELVHCKNKDVLKKGIMLIVNAVHWFNPLVWLMRRLVTQDIELFCDEEVLGDGTKASRKEYSEVIMSCIMEESVEQNVLSTSFVHGTAFMKRRFENIFETGKKKVGVICITGVAGIILLLSCVMQVDEKVLQRDAEQVESETLRGTDGTLQNGTEDLGVAEDETSVPAADLKAPTEEDVLAKQSEVLAGMDEDAISRLKKVVKSANLSIERDYLYGKKLREMEDPESLCWNYIDELGEIHIGWAYNTEDLARKALLNLSDEEFNERYGSKVVDYNNVDGATFIVHMTEIKDTIANEDLQKDFDALIWNMQQAMETHEVDYLYQIYRIFHDMDYYLLRYGPRAMAGYVSDMSTVKKYYGVLEAYK